MSSTLREMLASDPVPEVEDQPPARERPLILAAEDNKTNQLVFRKMLKNHDLDLTLVENGKLAVEAYSELQPDAIFMDISMPVMDGFKTTRNIRQSDINPNHKAVIIACSAHAMKSDIEKFYEAGMDGYISKPIDQDELYDLLEELREYRHEIKTSAPEPGKAGTPILETC